MATTQRVRCALGAREGAVCRRRNGAAMETTAHTQTVRRVAAVAAVAATVIGLVVPSFQIRTHAVQTAFQHGPAGGCGTSGC